jgi:hypothetical protein
MNIKCLVSDDELESRWNDFVEFLSDVPASSETQVLLCDPLSLDQLEKEISREKVRPFVILMMTETDRLEKLNQHPCIREVDDFLVEPIRMAEVFLLLRRMDADRSWREVTNLNETLNQSLSHLREDLVLTEKLQKSRLPIKFGPFKGLQIRSRYLAGLKSGGDYFDVIENDDQSKISLLMSDSSSYGLSSALLTTLMRMTVFLGRDAERSPREVVRGIHSEILRSMKDEDTLSFFYGNISKKDYRLRYIHYGQLHLFHATKGGEYRLVEGLASPSLGKEKTKWWDHPEKELTLQGEDRLFLCSDGFVEAAQGTEALLRTLNHFKGRESVELLNELAFYVKGKLGKEEMPKQDASALAFDVDSRILRLA